MAVLMVEAMQYADDATFRAHGKRGAAWKARNVVMRDRMKTSRVWETA
jgi:hypothetical protein